MSVIEILNAVKLIPYIFGTLRLQWKTLNSLKSSSMYNGMIEKYVLWDQLLKKEGTIQYCGKTIVNWEELSLEQ